MKVVERTFLIHMQLCNKWQDLSQVIVLETPLMTQTGLWLENLEIWMKFILNGHSFLTLWISFCKKKEKKRTLRHIAECFWTQVSHGTMCYPSNCCGCLLGPNLISVLAICHLYSEIPATILIALKKHLVFLDKLVSLFSGLFLLLVLLLDPLLIWLAEKRYLLPDKFLPPLASFLFHLPFLEVYIIMSCNSSFVNVWLTLDLWLLWIVLYFQTMLQKEV